MRAAEAFWLGREDAFERCVEKICPPELEIGTFLKAAAVKTGTSRDGLMYRADVLEKASPIIAYHTMWKGSMETESIATEAANRAISSIEKLDEVAKRFRQVVKNDLSSMKAVSDRVQTEVESMSVQYQKAASILTSDEFEKAVANAERMAIALKAISDLSETKLSVAVFGSPKKD